MASSGADDDPSQGEDDEEPQAEAQPPPSVADLLDARLPSAEGTEGQAAQDELYRAWCAAGHDVLLLSDVERAMSKVFSRSGSDASADDAESLIPGVTDFRSAADLAFQAVQKHCPRGDAAPVAAATTPPEVEEGESPPQPPQPQPPPPHVAPAAFSDLLLCMRYVAELVFTFPQEYAWADSRIGAEELLAAGEALGEEDAGPALAALYSRPSATEPGTVPLTFAEAVDFVLQFAADAGILHSRAADDAPEAEDDGASAAAADDEPEPSACGAGAGAAAAEVEGGAEPEPKASNSCRGFGISQRSMRTSGGGSKRGRASTRVLSESQSSPSMLAAGRSVSGNFLTSLSQHPTLPRVTFASKSPAPKPYLNPGPGSYNTHEFDPKRTSHMRQWPVHNFGAVSSRKGMAETSDGPGPGAYGVPKNVGKYATDQKCGFGGAPRGAVVRCFHVTAGPGQYSSKSTLCADAPAFTATGKRYRRHVKSLLRPGPGSYMPSVEGTSRFASAPQVGFGTMQRGELYSKHQSTLPGPGAYDARSYMGTESVSYSLKSRRRCHDLQPYVLPGPGQYASHAGSFGYPVGLPVVRRP